MGQSKSSVDKKPYADIVIDGSDLPSELPSIKVLIHDQLAATAIDSLEGSKILAHEISKSLVTDLLQRPQNTKQFGVLLKEIFEFEYMQRPTRDLIYWSIQTNSSFHYTYELAKYNLKEVMMLPHSAKQVASLTGCAISHKQTIRNIHIPYIQWILGHPTFTRQPCNQFVKEYLLEAQVFIQCFLS